jgi:hypothetical protein
MPNKQQISNRALWLGAALMIALSHSIAAQDAAPEVPLPQSAAGATESSTDKTSSSQNPQEAPIENAATAKPSLKYEPSERISEDSSVSFPVDI